MSTGRFVNLVWAWALRNADEEGRNKFERAVLRPPRGVQATVGPWSAQAEQQAFASLKAGLMS